MKQKCEPRGSAGELPELEVEIRPPSPNPGAPPRNVSRR